MKAKDKLLATLLTLCMVLSLVPASALADADDVNINENNFKDKIFRGYVKDNFDINKDNKLSASERNNVTKIDVENKGIRSLAGIGYFPNLKSLYCNRNKLARLDLKEGAMLSPYKVNGQTPTVYATYTEGKWKVDMGKAVGDSHLNQITFTNSSYHLKDGIVSLGKTCPETLKYLYATGAISKNGDNIRMDVTAYVKKKYTVKFNVNGGKKLNNKIRYVISGKTVGTLPRVSRTGYVFKGWYTKEKGGTKITAKTKIEQNRTLYARWALTTEKRAERIMKNMTWKQKLAQMFVVAAPSNAATIQKNYQFGGYVFFAGDFRNRTPKAVKSRIAGIQKKSKIKMLMAVDEEGGAVNRISRFTKYRKTPFRSPRRIYRNGGFNAIVKDTKQKDAMLKKLGLNTNFAPVADVAYKQSDFIYQRSFSTSAKKTSTYIKKVVTRMKKDNVVSTLKHFPGYGGNGDTHTKVIRDRRSKKTFVNRDLKPFSAGINAGCDMIMVSHNIVNCFDKNAPASISKKVHRYLRNTMKFKGVIITDSLAMQGVAGYSGSGAKAALNAVRAGNDMILITNYKQFDSVYKAFRKGQISRSQVNASVKRILVMKLNRGILTLPMSKARGFSVQ